MPGARAWLVPVRDGARRSAPTDVPLAGVGCVLVPLSDASFGHGCAMRHVLDHGIAMANYDSFLTTQQGNRHLKDQAWLVRVPKDCMLFVSPASYNCVVYLSEDKASKKEKDKNDINVGPCAHCLLAPLVVDSWKSTRWRSSIAGHAHDEQGNLLTRRTVAPCGQSVSRSTSITLRVHMLVVALVA